VTPGGFLVVDASVAVKWYVPELDSQRAHLILAGGHRLIAPDLLLAEVGNADEWLASALAGTPYASLMLTLSRV
jgi:predicted nucleic acid-binding protein